MKCFFLQQIIVFICHLLHISTICDVSSVLVREQTFKCYDQLWLYFLSFRLADNTCKFLRVDIVLQGATFFIVFSDADHMPPPYRVDNFSEVSNITHEFLHSHSLVSSVQNSVVICGSASVNSQLQL